MIKALDATKRTISITSGSGGRDPAAAATEQSFGLAQDVEVAVGGSGYSGRGGLFQEGTLAELLPGTAVWLTLSADKTMVEGIVAEEPTVRGVLEKAVGNTKTLTIASGDGGRRGEQSAPSSSYTLADDVEIAVDDGRGRRFSIREGQVSDLAAGAMVTLWLSLDKKQVRGVLAEGPTLSGTVKSSNAATKTLTLSIGSPGSRETPDERTIALADNAPVLLDDGKGRRLSLTAGKLEDIPAGSLATVRLSPDQTRIMQVRAEGARWFGLLKGVDAASGTITIALPARSRTEPGEEKTFNVAKDARILSEGNVAPLANLHPLDNGPFVEIRLSLDQKHAQSITSRQPQGR